MRCCFMVAPLIVVLGASAFGQSTAPAILAVPSAAAQGRAREMIRKVFAADYAKKGAADRAALARVLLGQAAMTHDDAAARYVALTEALDLAAGAGDAVTAVAAIEQMGRFYAVDPLELKRTALVKSLVNAGTAGEAEAVMRLALEAADQAVVVDAFEIVQQLTNLAEGAANKTRQVKVVASIQVRLAELRGLSKEFAEVRKAFTRLERNAADGEAHLTVGRFYALHKGQWALGLGHLAECSDAALRELARKELGQAGDDFAAVQLGDAWWDYAQGASGLTRRYAAAHAAQWYQAAQRRLEGITLARIQSRLQAGMAGAAGPGALQAAGPAIDVLGLIDPVKDTVQGKWTMGGAAGVAGMMCEASAYAAVALPYAPPEEFDLRVAFTRVEGNGGLAVLLATHNRTFGYALDVRGEARLERVAGKINKDNPTVSAVDLANGRRYTLTVQIRNDRVRALLDDRVITEWKTDYKDLSRYSLWKFPDGGRSALGVNNARVVFHAVEMVEVNGKGKATR